MGAAPLDWSGRRRDPGVERRLELVAEARAVEGRQLGLVLGVGVDPLDERRDVDLRQGVRTVRGAGCVDPRLVHPTRGLGLLAVPARGLVAAPGCRDGREREQDHRADLDPVPLTRLGHVTGLSLGIARDQDTDASRSEGLVDDDQRALHRGRPNPSNAVVERTVEEANEQEQLATTDATHPISTACVTRARRCRRRTACSRRSRPAQENQHDPERRRDDAHRSVDSVDPGRLTFRGLVEPLAVGRLLAQASAVRVAARCGRAPRPRG